MGIKNKDIYLLLQKTNVEIDSHCSDLYVPKTPETKKIIDKYEYKKSVSTFFSRIDKKIWYDIPCAFSPYYEKRQNKKKK